MPSLTPRLTPPEARFAALMQRRQQTRRTAPILRLEQNYGPEGMALLSAALLWGLCESFGGPLFFAFLVASGGCSELTDILLGLVFILFSLALWRGWQGVKLGRTFRSGRPFIKEQESERPRCP